MIAERWVCLARFDLLLIDGGGGFDCENIKFARYPCSCFGSDCENVKFDSGFALVLGSTCTLGFFNLFLVFMDLMEIRFGCWIWIWSFLKIGLVAGFISWIWEKHE